MNLRNGQLGSRSPGRAARALSLALLLVSSACEGETQSLGSGEAVCSDFQPGTNMLANGLDPALQAIGDFAMGSGVALAELGGACDALARSLGESPSDASEPPTPEEVSAVCSLAIGAAQGVKQQRALTFTAEATTCDVAGAEAACRSSCSDESTCDEFCTSSAAASAACPPATVVVAVEGEVPEAPDAELVALATGLGSLLGATARVDLMVERMGFLSEDVDFSRGLASTCIAAVVEVLANAVVTMEAAATIQVGTHALLEEPSSGD